MVMRIVRDDDPPFDEVEDELQDRLKKAQNALGEVVDEHKAREQLVDQEELLTRHFGQLVQEQLAAAAMESAAAAAMNDSEHKDGAVEGPGDDEQRAAAEADAAAADAPPINL